MRQALSETRRGTRRYLVSQSSAALRRLPKWWHRCRDAYPSTGPDPRTIPSVGIHAGAHQKTGLPQTAIVLIWRAFGLTGLMDRSPPAGEFSLFAGMLPPPPRVGGYVFTETAALVPHEDLQ